MTTRDLDSDEFDWGPIKLVVFDVDGTLYAQNRLRARMALDLAVHAALNRDLAVLKVIRDYRRRREALGEQDTPGFEAQLVRDTSLQVGCAETFVLGVINEWIETRPLKYLRALRYPHVADLFDALRSSGRKIGVFSDYPARSKLAALGLEADFITSASDDDVGFLKPNPRGLEVILRAADVRPGEAVLIGDRIERDGLAARRAGTHALIRSSKAIREWRTFPGYHSAIFAPVLAPRLG
jgi:putative hydrolase of the HAD superfamily